MKLLIYSHYFAPSVGGVETITRSLARGLVELRSEKGRPEFEVTVVTQIPADSFDDRELPFRVVRRPGLVRLWNLIRASDVIHLAGPSLLPQFLCWIAGKPLVLEHHGYQAVCPNGLLIHKPEGNVCPGHFQQGHYAECSRCLACELSRPRNWLKLLSMFPRHYLARRATANVAISKHTLERCALPRSAVIYYGIPGVRQQEHLPRADRISFAYVGRLVSEKGLKVLLQAASVLREEEPSFEIRLVGDGPEREELEAEIARKKLESYVKITGFLTGAALSAELNSVEVVVMPSIWEETAGLAAIEQMMRGKLVIASDIGGLGEVVGDAGLKFAAGDARGLADAMRRVMREPSLVKTLGEKARARAEALFRRDRMIVEHAELYRRLADRGSK